MIYDYDRKHGQRRNLGIICYSEKTFFVNNITDKVYIEGKGLQKVKAIPGNIMATFEYSSAPMGRLSIIPVTEDEMNKLL